MNTMNVLYESLEDDFIIKTLDNDISSILNIYDKQGEETVGDIDIKMQKGMYQNPCKMYNDILRVVRYYGYERELLELMPYIDDYICLFF
jgi:hypothetical protein